ncbi:MAG TPA: hypothetical protein VGC31_10705 [Paenirhodobacter sp.]
MDSELIASSIAARASDRIGPMRRARTSPASVNRVERVVRVKSRTPIVASSRATVSLTV